MQTKTTFFKLAATLLLTMTSTSMAAADQLAFPGAQGWGRFATGGRTGSVYHVTNLNDSGSGSLRDAVSQPNRIVVFDVAGVINIKSQLVFKSNITVAGQTAPGEGITVYGDGTSCSGASNVIIRYMRFRMGSSASAEDCGGLSNGHDIIFDHCSFSWAKDENFSINWDNKGTAPTNITIQNSIVGQGLMQHSAGGLIQADYITMYRVLLCDNKTRNFKVKGRHQYVNNIVYNWNAYAYEMGGESSGSSYANVVGNLFINGPQTSGSSNGFAGGNSDFHFYGSDNWQDRNKDGVFNPVLIGFTGGSDQVSTPYDYPELDAWAGNELIEKLLPEVGASLPYRDLADAYMVNEVLSFGTEGKLITKESELPIGVPTSWTMFTGTKPADTDGDGMPDEWETANGTNPNANDAMTIAANGYANIENYINGISRADRQFYLRQPMLPSLLTATTNSLTVGWADFSDNEEGFIVEIQKDGSFVEAGRTSANVSQFTITGDWLVPATAYNVRISAYSGTNTSDYATITAKTHPEQTEYIDDLEAFDGTGDGDWLIAPVEDETITLSAATPKNNVVVRSDANVTFTGTGYLSGGAALYKTGSGRLIIASNQQHEGPTVLRQGTYEFSTLKDGGIASGLGKSQEFAQNWVMGGGTYLYTGGTTSTNRSATLSSDTELNIANSGTVVTMNGGIEGEGSLTIGGNGQLKVNTANFFKFNGPLVLSGGEVRLASKEISETGIGSASKLVLQGGSFTTVGQNEATVTYNFPIEVVDGTTSTVDFDLWNTNKCSVTGTGTLQWNVHYLREYIEGNWDGFTGHLIINGTGKANQSQFAVRNGTGVKNATIELKGTASITGGKNASTYYLGGLSGDSGTALSGFNVKAAGNGTWIVGDANTDETFQGVIDDYDQAHSNPGKTSITKQGTGYWRLTGKNTYSGATTVNGGTLIVNGTNSGTGAVTVKSGTVLGGKGTIAGTVTIQNGGTLMVGDDKATDGCLTLNGGLKLNSGAILRLNDAMMNSTFTKGQSIQAFKGSVSSGEFTDILPDKPGTGLKWDTTTLYTDGVLKVIGENDEVLSTAVLTWNTMTLGTSDGFSTLTGNSGTKAEGFTMQLTGNATKTYSYGENLTAGSASGQAIKLSNGAANTITLPEGYGATSMTLWSYTNVTGTSYELSQQTNTGTNSASVYNFKNGFTITNSNSKNYATGGSTGIKFSAGVQYTITLPTGFNVCEVVFNGYDNYDDADAYIGEVNGEVFDATKYVFPKSKSTVSRTVRLSKVATGSMTFTVQVKQCVLSITLKGANGELFTSYWKEVGGKSYDASSATILQYTKDTNNPDRVSFELDDLSEISFSNAGNQQCVIISIDYHKLPEVIPGDANGDTRVDATDVSMVVNHILGLPTTGFIMKAADLNDDGRVDITDLTRLIEAIP